ncbi:MAG: 4-hydroxy-3-methylbut-2-enyl diphosphate reductase [Spirochaetia bacterium]|nr:4-hydroxy-3-methylbut-2-enyl diphosphate reductase [Spirochaetia bacterium]
MNIIRSEVMGFCSGVRTAVNAVYDAVELGKKLGMPVYTIGPLIHNEMFLEKLRVEMGVREIRSPEEASPGLAVIRAHGIPESERVAFLENGYQIIDGTCQRVLRSQQLVRKYATEGKQIFIAGNPEHGEVHAVLGAVEGYPLVFVIDEPENIPDTIDYSLSSVILSQTTFSLDRYTNIYKKLIERFSETAADLEIIDSICPSTLNQQKALTKLTAVADAILVIGGKQSANTRRLFEMVKESGTPVWYVSGEEELDSKLLTLTFDTIGITAGASTPEWLVEDIIRKLRLLSDL